MSAYTSNAHRRHQDLPGFSVVGENSIPEQGEEIPPPSLTKREIVELGCQNSLDILGIHGHDALLSNEVLLMGSGPSHFLVHGVGEGGKQMLPVRLHDPQNKVQSKRPSRGEHGWRLAAELSGTPRMSMRS